MFLSVVASTTALVRHNVEPAAWSAGIAMFTIVFAAGQIVGPALIGWVADATGGLRGGFALSAAVLGIAALVALPAIVACVGECRAFGLTQGTSCRSDTASGHPEGTADRSERSARIVDREPVSRGSC